MHKSIISFTTVLTLAALAASPTMAAPQAKAPTDAGECLKMLREIGPNLAKTKLDAAILAGLKNKGQEMAQLCRDDKFADAFLIYQTINKAIAGK